MERRVRWKSHARCEAGENLETISKDYLSLLLINLGAFYDGNGRDNYADVYNFRISVKKKLKDYKFGSQEWIDTNIEQEGYKLILNSASGVLDGSFDTNLRANNKALSMRIIGWICPCRRVICDGYHVNCFESLKIIHPNSDWKRWAERLRK